jgi:hypothetical protein
LKEHYEKVNAELFDPRITTEDYEPWEDAVKARAPSFDDNEAIPDANAKSEPQIQPPPAGESRVEESSSLVPEVGTTTNKSETAEHPAVDEAISSDACLNPSDGAIPSDKAKAAKHAASGKGSSSSSSHGPAIDSQDTAHLDHWMEGCRGDGIIYRDDSGKRVNIDRAGRPYPVGPDGWRVGKASGRPQGVDPEVWNSLRGILKKEGKTYEQYLAESAASQAMPTVDAAVQTQSKREHDTYDVVEVFSGEARITAACKEAGMTTGPPIDIKTGFDLLSVQGQNDARSLTHAGLPTIVFMAPVCTS